MKIEKIGEGKCEVEQLKCDTYLFCMVFSWSFSKFVCQNSPVYVCEIHRYLWCRIQRKKPTNGSDCGNEENSFGS